MGTRAMGKFGMAILSIIEKHGYTVQLRFTPVNSL